MERYKNKKDALEAVRKDGNALEYASEELKGDKEVVLLAVRGNGNVLKYASEELREDKEVVLEAVRQGVHALKYATGEYYKTLWEEEKGESYLIKEDSKRRIIESLELKLKEEQLAQLEQEEKLISETEKVIEQKENEEQTK